MAMTNESGTFLPEQTAQKSKNELLRDIEERRHLVVPILARIEPTFQLPVIEAASVVLDDYAQKIVPIWMVENSTLDGGLGTKEPLYLSSSANLVQMAPVVQYIRAGNTKTEVTYICLCERETRELSIGVGSSLVKLFDLLIARNSSHDAQA